MHHLDCYLARIGEEARGRLSHILALRLLGGALVIR